MSIPIFSFESLTLMDWFKLLANREEEDVVDMHEAKQTYLYEVYADDDLVLGEDIYPAGTYYMRMTPEQANQFPHMAPLRKLSFSDIVYLSDIFSTTVRVPAEEIASLAEAGGTCNYFDNELNVPTEALKTMREKVWTRSFDQGVVGIARRILSAIANFFIKYGGFIAGSSIYWPGDSCVYADKVIKQLNRVKLIFLKQAYEASKEVVSEHLDISLEDVENLNVKKLKEIYKSKALQLHPDKNRHDPQAGDRFSKVSQILKDFIELKEKIQSKLEGVEKEEWENFFPVAHQLNLFTKQHSLSSRQFKVLMYSAASFIGN